ncbi:DUF4870 domain-containing protein [Thalassiella azotivora]
MSTPEHERPAQPADRPAAPGAPGQGPAPAQGTGPTPPGGATPSGGPTPPPGPPPGPQPGGYPGPSGGYPGPSGGYPGAPGGYPGAHPGPQGPPRPDAMSPDQERTWAVVSHLSAFAAAYVALGFLGPLVCMLVIGDRSPYARRQAVEALNFNLTWLIYIVVSAVLLIVLVGFVLLPLVGIAYLILVILGAVAANRGEEFRYPLTIRFVS